MLKNKEELLDKIGDCLSSVAKKYAPKLFIYPFIITYGYKVLKYAITNNVEPKYSLVFSYFFVIIILLMVIDFMNRFISYDYKKNNVKICLKEGMLDDETVRIKAYHEAGHFLIAKMLELPIKEVNIINKNNVGGQLILDMPNNLKASQIKKLVMVRYAGFITESILNGEASDGCMGCDTSDMDSANILLRKYVFLTDDTISLTGYEEEYIKNKCIELSKSWKKEVESLVRENENKIKDVAEQLIEKKIIKVA